jgi:hypothetical protein
LPRRRDRGARHRSGRRRPTTGGTSHNRMNAGQEPRAYTPERIARGSWRREDRAMTRFRYPHGDALAAIGVAYRRASFRHADKADLERIGQRADRLLHRSSRPTGSKCPIWSPSCRPNRSPPSWSSAAIVDGRAAPEARRSACPGQRVCRDRPRHHRRWRQWARRATATALGRDLPVWQGCRVIATGEVFLMNPAGRRQPRRPLFRPDLPDSAVIGRASRCGPTRTATAASSGAPRRADRLSFGGSGARRWLS